MKQPTGNGIKKLIIFLSQYDYAESKLGILLSRTGWSHDFIVVLIYVNNLIVAGDDLDEINTLLILKICRNGNIF